MNSTLATRKPIDELTPSDLDTFLVWEFALEEEANEDRDETWVRPVDTRVIPARDDALIVAATLELANGKPIHGIAAISTLPSTEISGVALLSEGQYLFLPFSEGVVDRAEAHRVATKLALKNADIFPLRYRLEALIYGEALFRHGTIRLAP